MFAVTGVASNLFSFLPRGGMHNHRRTTQLGILFIGPVSVLQMAVYVSFPFVQATVSKEHNTR